MLSSMKRLAALCLVASAVVGVACADNVDLGQQTNGDDAAPPTFTPTDDGGDADGDSGIPEAEVLMCVGTECPYPYTTCTDTPFPKCGVNLMKDPANCGECGHSCVGFGALNMDGVCLNGECVFTCVNTDTYPQVNFQDCNKLLDDGCEIESYSDEENCGVCGHACAAGEHCIEGKCGCLNGYTDCNAQCVNLQNDIYNCGACGNGCEDPEDACNPMPANTRYGCGRGQCGQLQCDYEHDDCNRDMNAKGCGSDGCETNITNDTENCGSCGNKCAPGQICRDFGAGPRCQDPCEKLGLAECTQGCADLLSDENNCGVCANGCPNPGPNQVKTCTKGLCGFECVEGFGDCNNDPLDGCEVNLRIHPSHCGACGNQCDIGAGQPCVEGKCLMTECDAGVVTK